MTLFDEHATRSDSKELFTRKEQEAFRGEDETDEVKVEEFNMNLQGGKVILEPQKPKQSKADKALKETPPHDEIPEGQGKKNTRPKDVDYNDISHLKRIPELLRVYDALMLVSDLHEALVKAMLEPEIYEVAMAKYRLTSKPLFVNEIMFDEEEKVVEEGDHNRLLLAVLKCRISPPTILMNIEKLCNLLTHFYH